MKTKLCFAFILMLAFWTVNAQDQMAISDENPIEDFNLGTTTTDEEEDETGYGWSKGDFYISGSVGLWSQKQGDVKDNSFTIMPQAGFLATNNIAVGGQLGYMTSKGEYGGTTDYEINTFMVGAYGKWLFTPEDRFTPYLGVGLNYMSEKHKVSDITYDGIEVGAGAGLVYGLNDHFYIGANYALLSYSTLKSDLDGAESINTFTFGLDWKQLNFSLAYKF